MTSVIFAAFVPAFVLGHLYVAVFLAFLLLRFRRSREEEVLEDEDPGDDTSHELAHAPTSVGVSAAVVADAGDASQHAISVGRHAHKWFQPITLAWEDVRVTFTNSTGAETTVLQGQCGIARPGELLTVMGPSGAGKSTLMDLLSARALRGGRVRGRVTVNGRPVAAAEFVKLRAYVPQEDHFVPSMTALETVRLHAALDLPPATPAAEVRERAAEVLRAMGLSRHQHTLVGGMLGGGVPLRGLSGGQKRRLNIAARVVAAPPVVFLDEPTSGLDSTAALKVVSLLKSFATDDHTVIATLHQPSAAIWALLDYVRVLFMSFGRFMYLGRPAGVVPWFSGELRFIYDPTADGLPCDWVMDLLAPDMALARQGMSRRSQAEHRERLEEAAERFEAAWRGRRGESPAKDASLRPKTAAPEQGAADSLALAPTAPGAAEAEEAGAAEAGGGTGGADAGAGAGAAEGLGAPLGAPRTTLRGWLHQLRVLLGREALVITRNPADAAGRMFCCMYTGVLEGLVFLDLTQSGTSFQARLGCIFIDLVFVTQLPFVNMGLILTDAWQMIRESADNMYAPSACYAARLLINTALNSCNVIVYTCISYGLAGLRSGANHIWTTLIIQILSHLIMVQIMAVGAVAMPTQDMAFMLAVAVVVLFIMLANFLVRWQQITWVWVAALRFVSPMFYGFGSLVENEFKDRAFNCPPPGSSQELCVTDGNQIVDLYTDYDLGTTIGVHVAWWAGLHVITYAAMRWRIASLRGC
ncbi:hypothetical protein HYH03_007645 [Edaphochlamys debaryana]|uniref:ABC transporter domain-containing protein n=1 Tax=Edaphochlamys debaryana TaxID=47281 RepID=A0A836BZT5_9CHLO|nr:hypothetical protein HYH03_007645 [Edaphochlamys debaryana]|eukprot:KAG2494292.1 hypothetical protein HYH03_007645 [Edaphochlamys debaryana]